MDHVCESVGVGDVLLDTGFILGVHTQPIALDVDLSFMEPEFMPEYVATFRDECVEDSADDRSVPECNIPATPGLAIVTSDSYLGS
jgi:hypothetical protein